MIIVSLDEGGQFENAETARKHMFIGGTIFTCDNEQKLNKELKRMQRFFMDACKVNGAKYPVDLHFNHHGNINYDIAGRVKKTLERDVADFFSGRGKWNSDKPNGKYLLYAMASDRSGIDSFWAKGISNLLNDDIGSNRYEHMAYRSIENILFYNPRLMDDNDVRLDLATRLVVPKQGTELFEEIEELGHKEHQNVKGKYLATDATGFRAALASAIQNTQRNKLQVDLNVQPIRYYNHKTNLSQGFLYMADTLCTIFDNMLKKKKVLSDAMDSLQDLCDKLVGEGNSYLWVYDEIDQGYRRAIQLYEDKNYFDSIKVLYDNVVCNTEFGKVYQPWIEAMQGLYISDPNKAAVQHGIDDLYDYAMSSTEPNVVLQYSHFAFPIFEKMSQKIKDQRGMYNTLFKLYRIDIIRHNHEGDYIGAAKAYDKCQEYKDYISIEDFIKLRNTKSVMLLDALKSSEAIEFTRDTLSIEEQLVPIKEKMFADKDTAFVTYGRVLSQLGQCYAFSGRYDEAYKCFEEALTKFGENVFNKYMTLSFLLHAAVEAGDKDKYEQYAVVYFESKDRLKQLENIVYSDKLSKEYALYLFLKAQYTFYVKENPERIMKKVTELIPNITNAQRIDNPWEMIYKYCAFIYLNMKQRKLADEYMDKAMTCIENPVGIIRKILDNNRYEYQQMKQFGKLVRGEFRFTYR